MARGCARSGARFRIDEGASPAVGQARERHGPFGARPQRRGRLACGILGAVWMIGLAPGQDVCVPPGPAPRLCPYWSSRYTGRVEKGENGIPMTDEMSTVRHSLAMLRHVRGSSTWLPRSSRRCTTGSRPRTPVACPSAAHGGGPQADPRAHWKPISGDGIGRWRRDPTADDKVPFKKATGELLVEFGHGSRLEW